jgi:hypothetical protein
MYFPYLRGKQFEMIALRELSEFMSDKSLISPIIEPVKEATVTLEKTLSTLISKEQNFNLIFNPKVGDFGSSGGMNEILQISESTIGNYGNYQPTFIVTDKTRISKLSSFIDSNSLTNLSIICHGIPTMEEELFTFLETHDIRYIIINEDINSKRFLRNLKKRDIPKVTLSDPFKALKRNVDYIETDNEFFSDEHLFFEEDGYIGFSDFLTIGQEYSDSGFLPYAVAIHLTYPNVDNEFWIRHFVSDNNEDNTDVPGKFGEALGKLIAFVKKEGLDTIACREFSELYNSGKYPGLGTIKKLSIKHHIELVYSFLNTKK